MVAQVDRTNLWQQLATRPWGSPAGPLPGGPRTVGIVSRMPPRSPLIVPSVLPADFSRLGDDVAALEKAGVDRIQWDVMDGHFVPNLTFGPDVIAACRPRAALGFEAHLMVSNPDDLLDRYVEAGCELVIVHAEACTHLHKTLGQIRKLGARSGL